MHRYVFPVFILLQPLASHSSEATVCAKNIHEMNSAWGDAAFPLRWKETSMTDGKPLVVSMHEKNGGIHLQFIKEKEGLWAEGTGLICQAGKEFEIEFKSGEIRLGPAANWLLKLGLANGGKFSLTKIGSDQLRIKTSGWQGHFSSN